MTILKDEGDAIEGERVVCEYAGPRHLAPAKMSGFGGHREWRVKLYDAFCIIERKYRWLGRR